MGNDAYSPAPYRFDRTPYRRAGRSGLQLPPISLGTWQNFGEHRDPRKLRRIICRAFDQGVNHIDLANNYGPPAGDAERNVGRILAADFGSLRDELVISTKAGYDMWEGPYGSGGSRKHLLASLDQSLQRLGLDHVDVFYHHRPDPDTPMEESLGALADAVRWGKALYVGVSNYDAEQLRRAHAILDSMGVPLTLCQPSYSMFNRTIETNGVLEAAAELGIGIAAFSPLQQGLLTNRYQQSIPEGSRANRPGGTLSAKQVEDPLYQERVRGLTRIANARGQSLAQLALAWALRHPAVTTLLVGASSVHQLEQNLETIGRLDLDEAVLREIDEFAVDGTARA